MNKSILLREPHVENFLYRFLEYSFLPFTIMHAKPFDNLNFSNSMKYLQRMTKTYDIDDW